MRIRDSLIIGTSLLGAVGGSLFVSGCTQTGTVPPAVPEGVSKPVAGQAPSEAATIKKISFQKSIRPIFSNKCTICHNSEVLPKRPNFETREGALKSGMIVPGHPETSRILVVVQEDPGADKAMPPVSHRLTKAEIALLRRWIEEGADWPTGEAGRVKPAFIPQE